MNHTLTHPSGTMVHGRDAMRPTEIAMRSVAARAHLGTRRRRRRFERADRQRGLPSHSTLVAHAMARHIVASF